MILNYLKSGWGFIKQHPDILYSLALVAIIPLALYFNLNLAISSFQKNIDVTLQTKAFMIEKILDVFLVDYQTGPALEEKIKKIVEENPEIVFLEIKKREEERLEKIFSYSKEKTGGIKEETKKSLETAEMLSWQKDEAIGFLSAENNIRQWNVIKTLHNGNGEKSGIIQLALSLETADKLIEQTIRRSYIILIIAIFLVLTLIINHTRLFEYAVLLTRLKEIDKMKDEFVSMVAHELRTPVAIIKGYLKILKDKLTPVLTNEQADHFKSIIFSANHLEDLINDILEVSRIEQGRLTLSVKEVFPISLTEEIIANLKPKIEEKSLKISFKKPAEDFAILADVDRLRQILINLLNNALKYTPAGEIEVEATVEKAENKYYLSVKDTGLGISAEAQKRLFEKFYRVKNKKTEGVSGTGLGLWITKALCEKMNGDIFIESIEGVGSKFTIVFPLAKN